ncbi:MAG: FAD-dependent oxidoreductase [Syntrophotaleaceae bacterium]
MKYLIIGNSAAGTAGAEAIRRQDPQGEIIMISRDTRFYSRCQLHLVAAGKRTAEQADFLPENWAGRYRVDLQLGISVTGIDALGKQVHCDDGRKISYDRLLYTTGSRSALPPVDGMQGPGVYGLRDLADAEQLGEIFREKKHIVIIGGGLVGSELAEALKLVGHPSVSLVEMAPYPLPLQLESVAGGLLRRLMEQNGVAMYCGDGVTRVERSADGQVVAVHLKSGNRLPADLIVAAAGVRPNTELLAALGADCNRGIVIDEHCRTSLPDIFAAGDVTECRDTTLDRVMGSAIWPAARKQGRVAGTNMAGGEASLQDHTGLRASVTLFGTSFVSVGAIFNPDPAWQKDVYQYTDSRGRLCGKVCFTDDRLILKAAILWGDVSQAGLYGDAVIKRRKLGDLAPQAAPDYLLAEVG